MADSSEPVSKRLRRRKNANDAEPSTASQSRKKIESSEKVPSNSLLYLNDDCLKKVFERLDAESLAQMANVCQRIRPIASEIFREKHQKFVFKGHQCKNATFRRIIRKFGHFITSIVVSEDDSSRRFDISPIAKYCTNHNLKDMSLTRSSIDCDAFRPLIARLEKLSLFQCEFLGNGQNLFKNCPNLKEFGFYCDFFGPDPMDFNFEPRLRFAIHRFPKLEFLGFDCNYIGFQAFLELLPLNPQVKHIDILAQSEDMFIDTISVYTKNLETLAIHSGDSLPEAQSRKTFLKLSKLKKLQKLKFEAGCDIYGKLMVPLMDAFHKEKVPIERLNLYEFIIGPNEIRSILKLKTIKFLWLHEIVKAVSDADLVPLATQLPSLEYLQLEFDTKVKTPITVNGLVKMVEGGKLLQSIVFYGVQNLKIDQKAFKNILNAVQSRRNELKVTIQIVGHSAKTTSFNVPENVQQAASKHLKIIFSTQ